MARICWNNFTGGEVAPTLNARYNLEKFPNFSKVMQNMLPGLHGDASRRPGTKFVADLGEFSVLIPFSFNSAAANNFVLVLSDRKLRVSNGRDNLSSPITAPWAAADLLSLSWAQVGDIVYVAHQNYALHKIKREATATAGVYAWSIEQVTLNQSLVAPGKPTVKFSSSGSFTLRYKVVAVDANGKQSLPSEAGQTTSGKHPSDWVQGNRCTITWTEVSGATDYNVYREEAGYFGFIGTVSSANAKRGTFTSLNVNTRPAQTVKFSGTQTRTVVVGNGHVADSDTASDITVAANSKQNAYVIEGHAFIYVTETVNTTTWNEVWNASQGAFVWSAETHSVKEHKWVEVDYSTTTPAGTYSSWVEGFGGNETYPEGAAGGYDCQPQFATAATLSFIDNNYEADTSDTPQEDWNPFADGNNPGVVAFHQQRLILGGTKKEPGYFYASRTADFENFRKSRPMQDDDPIEYMIASGAINDVTWIASFGDLLIGTTGAEYKCTGGDGNAITPKEAYVTAQSYWGSMGVTPLIIGNSVLHIQRHGSRVRDLYYSLEKDGYAGNDLSILAPHLFDGHTIKQWAYQQTPGSHIWCVRDDGLLLALTYMKEQQITGWTRHPTDGEVQSVAVISGDNNDVLELVVKRIVNNVVRYYLERLADPFDQNDLIRDAFFVDCGKTTWVPAGTTWMTGLSHLEGKAVAVLADGSPVEGCVVTNGSITIPYVAKRITVGLPYTSILSPLPMETQTQQGVTLGKVRGYGKVAARLFRSVGGRYGADLDHLYDFPWRPETWGGPCEPYSGDLECTPHGALCTDATVYLVQERPLPWHIVAIMADVDLAEV